MVSAVSFRSFTTFSILPFIAVGFSSPAELRAQSVQNGDFEGAAVNWGCSPNIMLQLLSGGADLINLVDVLGGGLNAFSTADDSRLCQTVEGFEIGRTYYLGFHATRALLSPASVGVRVRVDGTSLDQTFTRSGAWGMSYSQATFTATATSHVIRFDPTSQALWGMVLDNIDVYRVSPLPIELIGFEAKAAADHVDLHWSTASELNNAYFSVERSPDNDAWSTVATVPGQENSQSVIAYSSVDADPPLGHVYYRLRQTDHDGTSTTSDVKVVWMEGSSVWPVLWPNPATDRIRISNIDVNVPLQVLDLQGRPCTPPMSTSPEGVSLDLSALPVGHYVLLLGDAQRKAIFIHQ